MNKEELSKFLKNVNNKIENMNDIFELVNILNKSDEKYFFRGQADSKWKLDSTYSREKNTKNGISYIFEERHKYLKDKKINKTKLEMVAWMQHYGVKSPLIDFTSDILHALWFAFSDNYEPDFKKENWFRTIYIISNYDIKYEIEEFKEKNFIYKCPFGIERGISQKSYFILDNANLECDKKDKINNNNNIRKINISNKLLGSIMKWLNSKNITGEIIYPDIKGIMIDFEKNSAIHFIDKGNYFFNLGKYKKAIECYQKALDIDPRHTVALNNKGNCLYILKQYKEAFECYDKAFEFEPRNVIVLYNKGLALYKLGREDEAKECEKKIKEIEENKNK